MIESPPPAMMRDRLLEYAVIGPSMRYIERNVLYINGKLLGPVARLAICKSHSSPEIWLHHCSEEWESLGVQIRESVDDAKRDAERSYEGLAGNWFLSPYSEEEASRLISESERKLTCSFCDSSFFDVNQMFGNRVGSVMICNSCVDRYHEAIHK